MRITQAGAGRRLAYTHNFFRWNVWRMAAPNRQSSRSRTNLVSVDKAARMAKLSERTENARVRGTIRPGPAWSTRAVVRPKRAV
jgi:hypothetical protein